MGLAERSKSGQKRDAHSGDADEIRARIGARHASGLRGLSPEAHAAVESLTRDVTRQLVHRATVVLGEASHGVLAHDCSTGRET
jgi:hypothetical protein